MRRVLFIETDQAIVRALTRLLSVYGIGVQAYSSQSACLSVISASTEAVTPNAGNSCILISDRALPAEPAAREQNLRNVCNNALHLPVMLVAEQANRPVRAAAMQSGAVTVIERRVLAAYLKRRLTTLQKREADFDHTDAIRLPNGVSVGFRIMQPEDAEIEQAFVRGLSMHSRYMRFFSPITELSPMWLERFTHSTYPAENALIATTQGPGREIIIGVARYGTSKPDDVVDFAVVVADDFHGQGLASMLMSGLIVSAVIAGVEELTGLVLRQNQPMLKLAASFGFRTDRGAQDPDGVHIAKVLRRPDKR